LTEHDARGRLENRLAVGAMIGGDAVIAVGTVLVFMNGPRTATERLPLVTPVVGPSGAHVVVTGGSDRLGW
jgi:hypothetical protein